MDWKCWWTLLWFPNSAIAVVSYMTSRNTREQRDKLQRIQNTAPRMITGACSSDHITPIIRSLHCLPVEARINVKILLITYKNLNQLLDIWNPWLKNIIHQQHYDRHPVRYYAPQPKNPKHVEDARFPLQHLSYGTLSQNTSKMLTVLLHLKQNLKNFYSGNISIDFSVHIFCFCFSILRFTILDV